MNRAHMEDDAISECQFPRFNVVVAAVLINIRDGLEAFDTLCIVLMIQKESRVIKFARGMGAGDKLGTDLERNRVKGQPNGTQLVPFNSIVGEVMMPGSHFLGSGLFDKDMLMIDARG